MAGLRLMEAAFLAAIAAIHVKVEHATQEEDIWIYRALVPVLDERDNILGHEDHGEEIWIAFSRSPVEGYTYRLRVGFHEWEVEYDHMLIDIDLDKPAMQVTCDDFDDIEDLGVVIHALASIDREGNVETERRKLAEAEAAERAAKRAKFRIVGDVNDRA